MTRKKLNKFLTENYNEIIEYDKNSIYEIDLIEDLARRYIKEYKDIQTIEKEEFKENDYKLLFTDREMIDLTRDIINNIDPKLLSKFDKLVDEDLLVFERNFPIDEGYGITNYNMKQSTGKCAPDIFIDLDFSYFDIMGIVHEFFHYLGINNKKIGDNHGLVTEIAPIYFEEYVWDFLLKNGIEKEKLNFNKRIICANENALLFLEEEIYYLKLIKEFSNNLKINNNIYNKYEDKMKMIEKRYLKDNTSLDFYSYITGTIIAYYAKENCSKKDMIKFATSINNKKYLNSDLKEILNTIGVDLHDIENLMKPTKKILRKKMELQKGGLK